MVSHPHGVDEQVEDRSATWKIEETLQEVEEFEEHLLESFKNYPEPTCQATMVSVNGYDRTDLEPHKPSASRLDITELVEMARCKRREVIMNYPRKPCKDGWMGPVPPEARDNEGTLLHNIRWWFYPCKQGGMPPFKYDGAIDQWGKTVMAFLHACDFEKRVLKYFFFGLSGTQSPRGPLFCAWALFDGCRI